MTVSSQVTYFKTSCTARNTLPLTRGVQSEGLSSLSCFWHGGMYCVSMHGHHGNGLMLVSSESVQWSSRQLTLSRCLYVEYFIAFGIFEREFFHVKILCTGMLDTIAGSCVNCTPVCFLFLHRVQLPFFLSENRWYTCLLKCADAVSKQILAYLFL